jgi:hypothetical protein
MTRLASSFVPIAGGALLVAVALAALAPPASAQRYFDHDEVERILQYPSDAPTTLPDVSYAYRTFDDPRNNKVLARATFYKRIGERDVDLGRKRALLVELLNRQNLETLELGDTLVVPSQYGLDFRAYAPFPIRYPAAESLGKVFVIHKTVQAFAAYEDGILQRWGVVNTGNPKSTPTPNGRFNFNWKTEYRVSSLSPPGEDWEMYWVFNFHDARGLHIHQYTMPTGGPASHGCVRLIDADAKWIYNWGDTWTTTAGGTGLASRQGEIKEQGTMVLILGDEPEGDPEPFIHGPDGPTLRRVELPEDPYAIPPGSPQQERFDARRAQADASQ